MDWKCIITGLSAIQECDCGDHTGGVATDGLCAGDPVQRGHLVALGGQPFPCHSLWTVGSAFLFSVLTIFIEVYLTDKKIQPFSDESEGFTIITIMMGIFPSTQKGTL